jgi:hypothetical protein
MDNAQPAIRKIKLAENQQLIMNQSGYSRFASLLAHNLKATSDKVKLVKNRQLAIRKLHK